jgi:peroxiredoxin
MPTIASNSMPLGHTLPAFTLPDVAKGTLVSTQSLQGVKALLVIFLCRHCPYVVHIRGELVRLCADYQPKGASFLGISSNDPQQYPEDAPERLREMAIECGFSFLTPLNK